MTPYTLTEPKGQITFRDKKWYGSKVEGHWAPYNPNIVGGWKDGDTLTVSVTFNVDPTMPPGQPQPPASQYYGLCVAALNEPTEQEIEAVDKKMSGSTGRSGGLFGGITTSAIAGSNIFYNAKSTPLGASVPVAGGGNLSATLIFMWTMQYNAKGGFNAQDIELIFGYGDPMIDNEKT